MRDSLKVVIGLGAIWGVLAGGLILMSAMTSGGNDTLPEEVALALYALTVFPSCIFAIWQQRIAGSWLLLLSAICMFAFTYQVVAKGTNSKPTPQVAGDTVWCN